MSWWSNALGNHLASKLNGDWLKIRIARSFIQRYLGDFLEEKLRLEQLNVQIIDGKAQISDLHLHVENVNRRIEDAGITGIQLVSGFVHSISVQIPWTNLLAESTTVELDGVELILRIDRDLLSNEVDRNTTSSLFVSESILQSAIMTTSMELAGEVVSEAQLDDTEERHDATQGITQLIMDFLTQVCVTLSNVRIRFEFNMNLLGEPAHQPMDRSVESSAINSGNDAEFAFELRMGRFDFFDEKASFASSRGVMLKDADELGGLASLADDAKCIRKHLLVSDLALYFSANTSLMRPGSESELVRNASHREPDFAMSTYKSVRFDDSIVDTNVYTSMSNSNASLYYSIVSRGFDDPPSEPKPSVAQSHFVTTEDDEDDDQPALDLEETLQSEEEDTNASELLDRRRHRFDKPMTCIARVFGCIDAQLVMCTMPDRTDRISIALHVDPFLFLATPKIVCDLSTFADCLNLTTTVNSPASSLTATATRNVWVSVRSVLCVGALTHEENAGTVSTGQTIETIARTVTEDESVRRELLQADGRVNLSQFRRFLLDQLDKLLPVHQLRLVCKLRAICDSFDAPRSQEEPETLKLVLDLATCEVLEKLFVAEKQPATTLLRFADDSSTQNDALMALRTTYSKKSDFSSSLLGENQLTALRFEINRTAYVDFDMTIIDRLQELIESLQAQQSATERLVQLASSRAASTVKRQRSNSSSQSPVTSSSVSLSANEIELRMRIPIPDLRKRIAGDDFDRFASRLRDESMLLRVRQVSVRSDTLIDFSTVEVFELATFFGEAALFLETATASGNRNCGHRVPLAYVCSKSRMDEAEKSFSQTQTKATASSKSGGIDLQMMMSMHSSIRAQRVHFVDDSFRILVRIRNARPCGSLLTDSKYERRQAGEGEGDADTDVDDDIEVDVSAMDVMTASMHPALATQYGARRKRRRYTPFSKTRVFLQDRDRQLTTPATSDELYQFYADHENNSRLQINIDLPFVLVELPSKLVFETVYNRVLNDFSLWEPLAPSVSSVNAASLMQQVSVVERADESQSMQQSCMTRSTVFRDFEQEDRLTVDGDSSQDRVCVNLSIVRGHLLVHCVDDSQASSSKFSFYTKLDELRIFSAVPFCPDTEASYTTFQLAEIAIYERAGSGSKCRLLDQNAQPAASIASFVDNNAFETILSRSGGAAQRAPNVQVAGTSTSFELDKDDRDMLVCVLKSNEDTAANRRYLLVSARLNSTCVHVRFPSSSSNASATAGSNSQLALGQLVEFFNVVDEAIPGYEPPRAQSFVYLQAINSEIVHLPRPEDRFPFGFAIDFDNLTLIVKSCDILASANGATSVPTPDDVVVRFLLDNIDIWLAKLAPEKRNQSLNSLSNAKLVRVLHAENFDLTIQIATTGTSSTGNMDLDGSQTPVCEFALDVRGQQLGVEACVDSCTALTQTIQYLARRIESMSFSTANSSPVNQTAVSEATVASKVKEVDQEKFELEREMQPITTSSMNDEQKQLMADALGDADAVSGDAEAADLKNEDAASDRPVSDKRDGGPEEEDDDDDVDLDSFDIIKKPMNVPDRPGWRCLADDDVLASVRVTKDHFQLPINANPNVSANANGSRRRAYEHWFDKPSYFPPVRSHYRFELAKFKFQLFGGSDFPVLPSVQHAARAAPAAASAPAAAQMVIASKQRVHRPVNLGNAPVRYTAPRKPTNTVATAPRVVPPTALQPIASTSAAATAVQAETSRFSRPRNTSESLLLQLIDVQFQHEEFHTGPLRQSREIDEDGTIRIARPFIRRIKPLERDVFLVRSVEIDDLLADSGVNKLLHPYCSQEMPQRTNAPMLCVKLVHVDADDDTEERKQLNAACKADDSYLLKISALPIHINLHQCTLLFCLDVAQQFTSPDLPSVPAVSAAPAPAAIVDVAEELNQLVKADLKEDADGRKGPFFKTVIFERDVLLVFDYVGGNQFDMQYGALAAVVGSLTQLRDCRIVLKRVVYERGLLGLQNVIKYLATAWSPELSAKNIVTAFEPFSLAMRLIRGVFDLFYEPFEQFRRNRSVLTGVKRGCQSFTQSTGVAALELFCRMVQCLEWMARIAHDVVSPQQRSRAIRYRDRDADRGAASLNRMSRAAIGNDVQLVEEETLRYDEAFQRTEGANEMLPAGAATVASGRTREMKTLAAHQQQPADARDGFAQASSRVRESTMHVAHNILDQALAQPNLPNAVGAIVTNVPAAFTQQAVNTADSLQLIVKGIVNQIDPNRKDREEKMWKTSN